MTGSCFEQEEQAGELTPTAVDGYPAISAATAAHPSGATMDESQLSPNSKFLALFGSRPIAEGSSVCISCDQAIERVIWPTPDDDAFVYVGWLDRLIATKACTFCQFLARMFGNCYEPFEEQAIIRGRRILCSLRAPTSVSPLTGVALDWDVPVSFYDHHNDDRALQGRIASLQQRRSPRFTLLADSAGDLIDPDRGLCEGDKLRSLARRVQGRCNGGFIREIYRQCLREHGDTCDAAQTLMVAPVPPTGSKSSRLYPSCLIDVANDCVVEAPANSRHVALSYCWAAERYLQLLMSNRSLLAQKGGIVRSQLPPTVMDAFDVMAALDERYLWVDCLCIVQDDHQGKMEEIRAMGDIYRNAALTIIAAIPSSLGRDLGLPGESRWYSRAWTYQEHELSKRELVFTPYQVFFACQRDAFSEEHVESACVHLDSDGNDNDGSPTMTRPCCSYQIPDSFDNRLVIPDNGFPSYNVFVRQYSNRQLSFEVDGLNAVSGLFSQMTAELGMPFICGLPASYLLERHVFWLPQNACRRRTTSTWFDRPFPSWSWVGWVGPVIYPIDGEDFVGEVQHPIANSLVTKFTALIWRGPAPVVEVDVAQASARNGCTSEAQAAMLSCQASLLRFVAPTALASVGQLAWGTFITSQTGISMCHAIFVDGHCAGLLTYDACTPLTRPASKVHTKEEAWALSSNTLESWELVALSSGHEPWMLYLPIHPDPDHALNINVLGEDGDSSTDHLPFDERQWQLPAWVDGTEHDGLINIMAIEWEGEVARRRGVGQVHPGAWQKACAGKSKTIVLG
ncbi:hypothetical protein LTR53_011700 [Teratosphaeriaceae sp. CCFEE 6253]|nr:hypothetical protein LTR53_011700 [Teratosphaeriaceae sp. CCFEE 6253]